MTTIVCGTCGVTLAPYTTAIQAHQNWHARRSEGHPGEAATAAYDLALQPDEHGHGAAYVSTGNLVRWPCGLEVRVV